jgi:tellurite resistance protein TehA-like permease
MAAVAVQGMGFCLSFMILAAFVYRLMTQKLPRDMQRPGVFISIGPSGFTAAGLGKHQRHIYNPLPWIPATKLTGLIRSSTRGFGR